MRGKKVVPLVRSAVDHLDVMQAFPSTSGGGNFTSALNVPNISKLPAQSSSKDMLKAEDHVARERRRRDIMNTRFQVLDSLLPKPIFRVRCTNLEISLEVSYSYELCLQLGFVSRSVFSES